MNRQAALRPWFEGYLATFNRSDFEHLGGYYAEDVAFHGQAARLEGRSAVIAFYQAVKARLDEQIELLNFVGAPSGERIFAELHTILTAKEDWPDFPTGPLRAGERRGSVNFVFYDIRASQFTRIRSARFTPLPSGREQ